MIINRQAKSLKFCILIIGLILISAPLFSRQIPEKYQPDELVCKMAPGYEIDIVNDLYGTTVQGYQSQIDCYLLMTHQGQDAESLAVIIEAMPEVAYCGPNYYLYIPEALQRSQAFLEDQGVSIYNIQPSVIDLGLPTIVESYDGDNIGIAVIDGGINISHPAFAEDPGDMYNIWDYVDSDADANDEPGGGCSGHGTFIAGIIRLAAPAADIYSYRVLDTTGIGDGYNVAGAIIDAVDRGCRVINISFGMEGFHPAVDEALKYAEHNNVVVTAAAGNDETDFNLELPFPASRTYCITVAALDSLNLLADFSNYGTKIDVCAPGTGLLSTFLETYFAWWDGTSFSTPFVTGQAALILGVNPGLTSLEVKNLIKETAINIDELNPDYVGLLGSGLIDIGASIDATLEGLDIDYDNSGDTNILDIVYLINFLYKDGPAPIPIMSADVDCSGETDILDVVYLINYLYKDGPAACFQGQY